MRKLLASLVMFQASVMSRVSAAANDVVIGVARAVMIVSRFLVWQWRKMALLSVRVYAKLVGKNDREKR